MTMSSPEIAAPLFWLPRSAQPVRNQFGRADGVPPLLRRLADERFDGAVAAVSNPHVLLLVLLEGNIIGASLTSGSSALPVVEGAAALWEWGQRSAPDAGTRSQISALERSVAESLSAALDPQPEITPLVSVDQLREALRHLATVSHHGMVDVTAGGAWGRVLFNHGRVLGAYQSENPVVVASLAGIGPLAAADEAVMTTRTVPQGILPRLAWPLGRSFAPGPIVEPSPSGAPAVLTEAPGAELRPVEAPAETEFDERIESDLLWLFSDVDRDRERASRSSASDAQLLQVLASFANSAFAMAADLAISAPGAELRPPKPVPQLPQAIDELSGPHPLLGELPMKGGRLDASALAKRCRALPSDGGGSGPRTDLFGNGCRALLALARQGVGHVTAHMSSPAVALRCATALEACMISIELELPSRRFRTAH